MSKRHLFLAASEMAEQSLDFLGTAESMAAEGKQNDAMVCLKAFGILAETELSDVLRDMRLDLARVAEGRICIHGPDGPDDYASAHEAVQFLWSLVHTLSWQQDATVRPDLLNWLGVNTSTLHAHLLRERAKLLAPRTPETEAPKEEQTLLPTVWYHGGRSYSVDAHTPANVSEEQHNVLKAFLDRDEAFDTKALQRAGASNVTTVIDKLAKKFGDAVHRPKDKGAGYFIRVRSLKPK